MLMQLFSTLLILSCSFRLSSASIRSQTMGQGFFVFPIHAIIITIIRITNREGEVVLRVLCYYLYITMSKSPKQSINLELSFLM